MAEALLAVAAPKIRFDALTSWRFVAGFHLVLFHEMTRQHWNLPQPWQNIGDAAYMQVAYFFLVSGFVFGIAYGGAVERGTLKLRDFWLGRLSRLYPVYILSLLLAAPFYLHDLSAAHHGIGGAAKPFLVQAAAKILLLQAWIPQTATEWNPPSWAMSAVAFFYLVFPFVAKPIVSGSNGKVVRIAVGMFALSLIPALIYCSMNGDGWLGNTFDHQTNATVFMRLNPAIRLPEFVLGLCLARLYKQGAFEQLSDKIGPVLVGGGMLVLVLFAAFSGNIPYMLLHHTLPIIPYVALIVGLAKEEARGGVKGLRHPWLVQLGNASFSMFILHVPLFMVMSYVFLRATGSDRGPVIAVVNVVLTVVLAQLGVRYLEGPSRQWMNRVLRVGDAR